MVADFTSIFPRYFCVAEYFFDEKTVSKFSWLVDKISESRNIDALHVSEKML